MTTNKSCYWEHFSHDADVGIRGIGDTMEHAFAEAAKALTATICDIDSVKPEIQKQIKCAAPDNELLFVEARVCVDVQCEAVDLEYLFVKWINALVYEMAVSCMLFSRFEVQVNDHDLRANIWGEKVDKSRHEPAVEVKGATYTELKVTQTENSEWLAQCIIDV